MINPQQNTVDKVIQKAVDIGLIEKTQDYLKQGYKVDNLSNGSIGIHLGNDEDTQELEYKTQKASSAQQENTPMTAKLTAYKAELLECLIDTVEVNIEKSAIALQQLSDAHISLLQAYTTGVGVLVAENDLIAVREQYNAIHGV